jgi:pimeloyl-ACP methyl ester carboxylesterase
VAQHVDVEYHRSGTGPPLVLIHGIGSHWQMWLPVLSRLESEREVIAFDLPGFGASPMPPPGTPAGIGSLTDLSARFLDQLELERPHVAGNSLGGWIALELAKRDRVASATALSPLGFHNSREAIYQRASLSVTLKLARLLAPHADWLSRPPALRRLTWSQIVARPELVAPSDAAAAAKALAGAPWFEETLPTLVKERFTGGEHIDPPVTIAWGEKDRLLLARQAPRAARRIPGARLVMLTGCGHVPTYDDPPQVARVLLDGSRHAAAEHSHGPRPDQAPTGAATESGIA